LVARLYERAKGEMWQLPHDAFAQTLAASALKAVGDEVMRSGETIGAIHR